VNADTATSVTLCIVAALPTPELRADAFLAVLTHTVTAPSHPDPYARLAISTTVISCSTQHQGQQYQ
jgi:hypothetical protein